VASTAVPIMSWGFWLRCEDNLYPGEIKSVNVHIIEFSDSPQRSPAAQ